MQHQPDRGDEGEPGERRHNGDGGNQRREYDGGHEPAAAQPPTDPPADRRVGEELQRAAAAEGARLGQSSWPRIRRLVIANAKSTMPTIIGVRTLKPRERDAIRFLALGEHSPPRIEKKSK
jgi:hypothetical protein